MDTTLKFFVTILLSLSFSTQTRATLNYDKLAYAVAMTETNNCKAGVGKTLNNCFGIRNGRGFKKYSSPKASYSDFKELWAKRYGIYPNLRLARKYCPPGPAHWLKTVNYFYFNN